MEKGSGEGFFEWPSWCCQASVEAFLFLDLERGVLPRRSRRHMKLKKDIERF
jgi:hypothetical protein